MSTAAPLQAQVAKPQPTGNASHAGLLLQRKCACGSPTASLTGECAECASKKRLQAKLTIGTSNDPLEQEADRVADQVMAAPTHSPVSNVPPWVQRYTAQSSAAAGVAPASVDRVLASPGSPLEPALRQDMEQRFSHDFSRVRVHSDNAAEQSARDVSANAYTVGYDIVFGAGRFAPTTIDGRRLIAHELTHVVQQSNSCGLNGGQEGGKGGPSPIAGHDSVRRDIVFGAGELTPVWPRGGHLLQHRLQQSSASAQLQRETGDPLEEIEKAGLDSAAVQAIVLDPGTRRARFHTIGGKTYNGKVTTLASSFPVGEYLLERASPKDPERTWNIFNTDGTIFRGGLQFKVLLEGVDFDSLGYVAKVKLKVANGLLPALIDVKARIQAIKDQVSKTLVNDAEELAVLKLFEDIPPEQASEFIQGLRNEKVSDVPLLERLDSDVDGENNIALHQHLSRLKLQAGGAKAARALADAPELAWHDVMGFFEQKAVFSVTPNGNGKYRIRYLGGVSGGLFSSPEYAEIKKLSQKERLNLMTGQGVEVDADQPIIVHDYDNDRQVVLTAEDLIAYQHSGVRKFLQDVGTVASIATPAGAETIGARVLAYGVQIATLATLIVDENKLNIRKWFPNWGPAIIDASEKVKLAIVVIGIAQLVQGGWKLITNLRRLRAARAAMDAKPVATTAEEIALAEKQAAQLEANADKLLSQADLVRKELGLAEDLGGSGLMAEGGATAKLPEAGAAVTPAAVKARIIESAIGKGDFGGEFAGLANRELANAAKNPSRLRPARVSGYSVEVQIEGTDHFLARNAKGSWCLFSSTPRGCGAISVAKTVDELFEEIGRELGTSKAVRIGNRGRVDLAAAVADAEGVAVDLKVQPHSSASDVRAAQGVSGKDVQSAHHAPTAAVKGTPGYSRESALTVLLPRATHKAFDDYWKQWSIAQRQAGVTQVTVERFVSIVDRAIQQTPGLDAKTKGAMSWVLQNEFKDLGLKPADLIDLPYSNIKPNAP